MLIGIVSKEEHVKVHALALEQDGYTVRLLGADPVEFPPNLDVLLLRHLSSSHQGLERARAYAKIRKIPMIAENGLTGMRMALTAMQSKHQKNWTMVPTSRPPVTLSDISIDGDGHLAEALLSGNPSSFAKQLTAQFAGRPALFVRRGFAALEAKSKGIPPIESFRHLWASVFDDASFHPTPLRWVYATGLTISKLDATTRQSLIRAFMAKDQDSLKHASYYPNPIPREVQNLAGQATAYLSFYMWLLSDEKPKRTSLAVYAYKELSGGSQMGPRGVPALREVFGFEWVLSSASPPAATRCTDPVTRLPQVDDKVSLVVPVLPVAVIRSPDIIQTVQDEILTLAIRMEESEKASHRFDALAVTVASANEALSGLECRLLRVEQDSGDVTRQLHDTGQAFHDQFGQATKDFMGIVALTNGLAGAVNAIETRVFDLPIQVQRLAEQVQRLSEQVQRLSEQVLQVANSPQAVFPAQSAPSSLEDGLRFLKALGASVVITL